MGHTGATGATGPQGEIGATGASGIQGEIGATGASGIQGLTGATGVQGLTGSTGATGVQGEIGATGASGLDGATGATGLIGATGVPGTSVAITGSVANVNDTYPGGGPNDPDGLLDYYFPTAVAGDGVVDQNTGNLWVYDGAQWDDVGQIVGPDGATGLTGATGVGATGPQGATGTIGATGATGPQGEIGATGLQGEIGATGASGVQGFDGATGASGLNGATGLTGSTGPQGTIGATGASGVQGLTGATGVQGFEGATGVQGDIGSTGVQGFDGATGPQGEIGATGVQGNVGATGATGYNGATGATGLPGIVESPTAPSNTDVLWLDTGASGIVGQGATGLTGATGAFSGTLTGNINGAGYSISNANSYTGNTVSVSGNITSGDFLTSGQITSTGAGNTATNGGQIFLNGATLNRIDWNTNGTGAPEYTTRSVGAKVVLYPSIGGSATDYALGVEAGALWSGIPGNDAGQFFKWYGGNVPVASLSGTGVFSATGNISGGNIITTGNVTGNTAGFAIGYRDIPQVSFTANTTIATTDAGRHYYSTLSTGNVLTIANNASQGFQIGAAISIINQGSGNITVAQGSGVTLYLAGNATSGNRSVATFGMATLIKVATDTWFINGTGVS
jgi:hypothetical protein